MNDTELLENKPDWVIYTWYQMRTGPVTLYYCDQRVTPQYPKIPARTKKGRCLSHREDPGHILDSFPIAVPTTAEKDAK